MSGHSTQTGEKFYHVEDLLNQIAKLRAALERLINVPAKDTKAVDEAWDLARQALANKEEFMYYYEVQIIQHFDILDEECDGDYLYVTVNVDGIQVAKFGDHYHDKGAEKADGWVEGFKYAAEDYEATVRILDVKRVNDSVQ